MPGIVQELDLILNQASLGKTIADAKKAGTDIGNAIGNAPAVKDAAHKLGEAISTELKKATDSAKMDMASLAASSGPLRQAVNPMTAAMSAAAAATSGLGAASTRSVPGLRLAQNAIFNLAAQAASAPGPVGKLAEALLTFGTGGPIAIGVAATLGATVLAFNSITSAAKSATDALKKMNGQFSAQQLAKGGAVAQVNEQIKDLEKGIKEDQKALAELLSRASAFGAVGGAAAELGLFGKQFKDAKEQIDAAREAITKLKQERDALFAAGQSASAFGSMTSGHFDAGLSAGAGHGRNAGFDNLLQADADLAKRREEASKKAIADAKELTRQLDAITESGRRAEGEALQTAKAWGDEAFAAINKVADEEAKQQDDLADKRTTMMADLKRQIAATTATAADDLELELHDLQTKIIETFGAVPAEVQPLLDDYRKRIAAAKEETAKSSPVVQKLGTDWKKVGDTIATVGQGILDIAHGLGLVNENMDKVAQGAISMGKNLAGALSGDPSSIVGFVGGAVSFVGGLFHSGHDEGRLRTNAEMFDKAMNGDTEALEFLRTHSVVSQNGSVGWGSQKAADDAHAKYMEAKAAQDAAGQPARDAANAQHDAEVAAMQKQAALDQQRANEEGQVAQHQAQADMDHRAQVFKDANRLGLGSAAANTGALFQAAAIAGQGALGHDSPLYVEAEKKAEDALRDLENQVSQAQKQVDDAKKTKADEAGGVLAGFTVQRSLTAVSGDRIVGELTTQTVYLKDIRDAVAPQGGGAAAGILAALPPIHVTSTLNVDGEKMATNVSRHQSRKLQQHQMRNGIASMNG
jgi:hypothetical protein